MALKDMFAFVKDGLEERFNTKPRDPVAARKPLLKGIDMTLDQFTAGRTRVPNKWWVTNNGIVAFSPKLNGTPLVLNGGTTSHVETDDFPAFLAAFRHAVEEGELDGEIAAIESGAGVAGHSVAILNGRAASVRKQPGCAGKRRPRAARATKPNARRQEAPEPESVPAVMMRPWSNMAAPTRSEGTGDSR